VPALIQEYLDIGGKMEIMGKKILRLYLTDWQRRMVKDALGVDCHVWEVPIEGTVIEYGIRTPQNPKVKKMYLTDWQKREMMDEAGIACNFIELEKGTIVRYGMLAS
jgi:hypothetical protein